VCSAHHFSVILNGAKRSEESRFIIRNSLFDTRPEHIRTELVEVAEGLDIPFSLYVYPPAACGVVTCRTTEYCAALQSNVAISSLPRRLYVIVVVSFPAGSQRHS